MASYNDTDNERINQANEERLNRYARGGLREMEEYMAKTPEEQQEANEQEDLQKEAVDQERAQDPYRVNLRHQERDETQRRRERRFEIRRLGPISFSLATIFATTGLSAFMLGPLAFMAFMEKAATNFNSTDTKFNVLVQRAHIGSWYKNSPCKLSICDRATSMGEKMRLRLEAEGFKVEPAPDEKTKTTRNPVITFEGKTVTDAKGFHELTRTNARANAAAMRAINPRTASFIDKKAKLRKILAKHGASLSKVYKAAYDEKKEDRTAKMNQELDRHTGATTGDGPEKVGKLKTRLAGDTKLGKAIARTSGKVAGAADMGALACGLYSTVKVTLASVKLNWYKDLILFMLPFFQTAAMIEDQGNVEVERVEHTVERLVETDPNKTLPDGSPNPGAGGAATDSQAFQRVLYGDSSPIDEVAKMYTTWWITSAVAGSSAVRTIEDYLGGRENVHKACVGAKAASLAGTAFCVSNPFSFVICGAAIGTAILYGDDITKWIVENITAEAAERMAEANLNSNLKYEPLGTALVAGIGILMMEKGRSSHLKPAKNSKQLKEYDLVGQEAYDQHVTQIARQEGKEQPFNPYKQYSFAGQLVSALNPYLSNDKSAFRSLANMFMIGGSALASITPKSFASSAYMQPNPMYTPENIGKLDDTLSRCEDPDMRDINVVCTWYGGEMVTAEKGVLEGLEAQSKSENELFGDVITYMHDHGYIDGEGKAIGDTNPEGPEEDWTEKTEYVKYLNTCTEDREFPIGSASLPIDDTSASSTNAAWDVGARCAGNNADGSDAGPEVSKMIDMFMLYGNLCRVTLPILNEINGPDCGNEKDEVKQPSANMPSSGDWGCPVNPANGGVQTQEPHDIGNSTASGVDYNYGYNTPGPIYAVRDGTVTVIGPATGYGHWIQVEHEENGQKVTSYYGHILGNGFKVKVGDKVKKGDHIADIGDGIVGESTAPHLHIGLIMGSGPTAQDYETRFMKACADSNLEKKG